MGEKTYTVFNITDDDGINRKLNFDIYHDLDTPLEGGGVYIFAKTYNNMKDHEYYQIGCIPQFSLVFDKENISKKF